MCVSCDPIQPNIHRKLNDFTKPAVLLIVAAFASETEACGYTDPGSGALIWQLLVAGFVGSMFYVRRILSWLRDWRKDHSGK